LADTLIFGVAAFLIVASAMMVVVSRHPIHSALFLVLSFLGLAVIFFQLNAPFLAAVQVIVYAGAIMVLFLFVIMLLGEDKPLPGESRLGIQLPLGILFALILAAQIGYMLIRQPAGRTVVARPPDVQLVHAAGEKAQYADFGSVKALGNELYTQYLFAFEATSIVLLVAMVGVVVLAKRRL
jgi:NADH-quinone oxidoreductase subunit J